MSKNKLYGWLNTEKSRYYTIVIENQGKNRFALKHSWGGCYSNRGGKKDIMAHGEEDARRYIDYMMKRRKSRGYELVTPTLH